MEVDYITKLVYSELKQLREIKTVDAGAAAILDFLMTGQPSRQERLVELLANSTLITKAVEAMKLQESARRFVRFPAEPIPMVQRLALSRLASDYNLSDLMKIAELVSAKREKSTKHA